MDVVSVIIPNRGGTHINDVIDNINQMYSHLNKEFIIVHQDDTNPFMRGQLYNIGVKYSTGNFLALTDNDIYHLRELPLYKIYSVYQCPLVAFKAITQLTLQNNKILMGITEERPYGFGAFTFLSKLDFMNVNGFSNLYVGWGAEDNEFIHRFNKFIRIPQNLGHITHPRRVNTNEYNTALNHKYLLSRNTRDNMLDGIKQTCFNILSEDRDGDVLHVHVNNITVSDNFAYADLLEQHYKRGTSI